MEPFLGIGVTIGVVGMMGFALVQQRKLQRNWEALLGTVAPRYGLTVEPGNWAGYARARRTTPGSELLLRVDSSDNGEFTTLRVQLRLPEGLGFARPSKLGDWMRGVTLDLGLPLNDAASLRGSLDDWLPLLDAVTRAQLIAAMQWKPQLRKGVLRCSFNKLLKEEEQLVEFLDALVPLVDRLTDETPARERLLRMVHEEPVQPLRILALRQLVQTTGAMGDPELEALLRILLQDPAPELRLAAARWPMAGRERFATLAQLCAVPGDQRAAEALDLLRIALPEFDAVADDGLVDEVRSAMLAAVERGLTVWPIPVDESGSAWAAAWLRALKALRQPLPRPAARTLLQSKAADEPRLAPAVGEALVALLASRLGGPDAEVVLLRLIEEPDEELVQKAVEGLEHVGGRDAIEPLLALDRGWLGGGVTMAARRAVERIQERLGGQRQLGGLAVLPDAAGGLSQVEQAGGLSEVGGRSEEPA